MQLPLQMHPGTVVYLFHQALHLPTISGCALLAPMEFYGLLRIWTVLYIDFAYITVLLGDPWLFQGTG